MPRSLPLAARIQRARTCTGLRRLLPAIDRLEGEERERLRASAFIRARQLPQQPDPGMTVDDWARRIASAPRGELRAIEALLAFHGPPSTEDAARLAAELERRLRARPATAAAAAHQMDLFPTPPTGMSHIAAEHPADAGPSAAPSAPPGPPIAP